MALFFLVGGGTTLAIEALPHPAALPDTLIVTVGAMAVIVAIALQVLRHRVPPAIHPWFLAMGTGLVTLLVATGGSSSVSTSFSFFYLWVIVYSLLFFSPAGAALQLVAAVVAYVGTVAWIQPTSTTAFTAVEPLVLGSVIGTTGIVILMLMRARETSEIDPLTLALNRRGLERFLGAALDRVLRTGQQVVVAMVDVDHFKMVNDSDGHDAGDQLLRELADRWRRVLRPEDCLSRFGGDEFVVVLPGCSEADAAAIIERLRLGSPQGVTCSVGMATWRRGEADSTLLKRADAALYDAKRSGRNRIEWGRDPALDERRRPRT